MGRKISFDKQEILQICMQLFWQKGYVQTSMRDLQAATNLSGRSLIHSFGDKREIFEKCLQQYLLVVDDTIEKCEQQENPLNFYFELFDQADENDPRHNGCFILNCAHGDLLEDQSFIQNHQNFKEKIYKFFNKEIKNIASEDVDKKTQCLLDLFLSGLFEVAIKHDAKEMNKQAEIINMLIAQWKM